MSYTHAGLRRAYNPTANRAARDQLLSHAPDRPILLAVTDRIDRDGKVHDYAWRMHTDAANLVRTDGSGFVVTAPSGANMAGRASSGTAAGGDPAFTTALFQQQTALHTPLHTVLSAETTGAVAYDNLAVVAVTPPR